MDSMSVQMWHVVCSFLSPIDLVVFGRVSKFTLVLSRSEDQWYERYREVWVDVWPPEIRPEGVPMTDKDQTLERLSEISGSVYNHMIKALKWVQFMARAFQPGPHADFVMYFLPMRTITKNSFDKWWEFCNRSDPKSFGEGSRFRSDLARVFEPSPFEAPFFYSSQFNEIFESGVRLGKILNSFNRDNYSKAEIYMKMSRYTLTEMFLYCIWRCLEFGWRVDIPRSATTLMMEEIHEYVLKMERSKDFLEYEMEVLDRKAKKREEKKRKLDAQILDVKVPRRSDSDNESDYESVWDDHRDDGETFYPE
jgi:hypothetical protein